MRWKNAWILTRKDLDEFKKQKLLIGSIIAMPLILGIIMPVIIFVPLTYFMPMEGEWDIEGLTEIGESDENFTVPLTNQTLLGVNLNSTVIRNATITESRLDDTILDSCIIKNSTISNSIIRSSAMENSRISDVLVNNSKGKHLDGKNIFSLNSDLEFKEKKESEFEQYFPMMLNYVLIMFIILPAVLPTLIASYSIVGEKNNKSLEPLFATPITDGEILAGKVLSAFLPSMLSTIAAFFCSVMLLNVILEPRMGYYPLPNLTWLLSILLLAPTACIMSILASVLVSSKVTDVRAAQQVGGFVVMPVIILMIAVLSGIILLSPLIILIVAGIYIAIDLALFFFTKAIFNREDILVNWA
jgi:ABC-2 type transport system permease protein